MTWNIEHFIHHLLVKWHKEEAASMFLHTEDCSHDHGCIAVQSPDTDEALLCISKCLHLRCAWRWFCTETKDILGYLHHLILELGWELITKFDITSGFSQTDQRKALKAHVNNNMHTCIYRTYENKYQEFVQSAEAFRSSLYTPPRKVGTTANEVRYEVNNLMY